MLSALAEELVTRVRCLGHAPVFVGVSPDLYTTWEKEKGGEPLVVAGIPIRIRDNYKPKTMLVLGHRIAGVDAPELGLRKND